jgi:hypothetical protein
VVFEGIRFAWTERCLSEEFQRFRYPDGKNAISEKSLHVLNKEARAAPRHGDNSIGDYEGREEREGHTELTAADAASAALKLLSSCGSLSDQRTPSHSRGSFAKVLFKYFPHLGIHEMT